MNFVQSRSVNPGIETVKCSVGQQLIHPLILADETTHVFSGLIPAFFALLFLYWWLLINDLLEEINEDKKADLECLISASECQQNNLLAGSNGRALCGSNSLNNNGGTAAARATELRPRRDMTLV